MPETMPIPVRFQDGEALSAAALNQIQELILRQLLAHTHSGPDGAPLGPEGIAPGTIQSKHLGPIGLGPDQIAPGAVGSTQLAEHVVAGHHMAPGAILTEALAASAVTLEKLANDVLAEIKKPRGATTYGWCAYLDPALLYPASAGNNWYDWLLDANVPLPGPRVALLDQGNPLPPFLLDATLDASPPVKPKGPPAEPKFVGVDPGPKPEQPSFTATPPTAPNFARPTEPQRPRLPDYQPPGAPPQPKNPEMGEPSPSRELFDFLVWLQIDAGAFNRQLDNQSVADQMLVISFQQAALNKIARGIFNGGVYRGDLNHALQEILNYRHARQAFWANRAEWDGFRAAYRGYEGALAAYQQAFAVEKDRISNVYDQAMRVYAEQLGAWQRYDQAFAAFQGAQAEYQRATERYQADLRAWEERSANFHQAEGEYRARREEYDRLKAEYDEALARYQTEKKNFVARIQPPAGFPAGKLIPQRFQLQVDPAQIGWAVSPVGPQHLRPALITNEPFTTDAQPVTIAPGQALDQGARTLIAQVAYAFGLPEDVDPMQRMSARLYQFINTPGFLLGGYHGELRNVRSIARMHEGESRFVRIQFERPYPAATYTVSVTPDGRPGAPVPQPFVWRQTPTFVDLCFQVGSALVDTVAFRFAIHGELSES